MAKHIIELQEDETAYLIRNLPPRTLIPLSFGPGWVGLKWDDEKEMTPPVRLLLLKRGVLNENMEGAGI